MSNIKPSSHGIVVENKDNGMHYAIHDDNYSSDLHRKVRDLRPEETVLGYTPRHPQSLEEIAQGTQPSDQGSSPEDVK